MSKFEIKNRKGLKIAGEILMPESPKGLSFILHGLGSGKDRPHIKTIAHTFFENNYIAVNIDATNSINDSEGKYENATMQNHYDDLVDVISWAKKQEWYKQPFILAGSSLGGYAVAQYAENYPSEVKAVFPLAAVISGKLSIERMMKFNPEKYKQWKETGWFEEESRTWPGLIKKLPWSHMEERLNHDLVKEASKITMPVLFMVGSNDISHIEDQKIFYDAIPENTPKEFYIIEGASHTFRETSHINKLKEIFDEWLKKLK